MNSISNLLVKLDNTCDYIPVVSTLSNLTDLFQKCVILPLKRNPSVINSHYYTHLEKKSALRCIILLIPVIGNFIVGIYDFKTKKSNDRIKASAIAAVQQNGWALESANERLKADRDVVLAAVQQNGWALEFASKRLRDDRDIVLAAVRQNVSAFKFANRGLKDDRDMVLAAVQQNGWALYDASERLKADRDVVLAAVQQNGLTLQFASERLQDDRDVVLAAVQQNGWALQFASERIRKELRLLGK